MKFGCMDKAHRNRHRKELLGFGGKDFTLEEGGFMIQVKMK